VTNPMSGKNLEPAWLFGDAFDAVPSGTGDTRCCIYDLHVFGAAAVDNSAVQFGFIQDNYNYVSQSGNDVNVGDVTVPEGDGGLGAQGCGGKDCKNSARVIVSLESPCTDLASCYVTVIADNTTGGSANGTPKGNEVLAPGPADYKATTAAKPKVLRIAYGKSTAKFTIPIVADQAVEAAETIFVDVVSVSAGLVVNDGTGMVTIVDDDDLVEPDTGISIGDAIVYETAADPLCKGVLKCKGVAVLPIVASTGVLADTTLTYTIGNGDDVPGVYEAAEAVDGKTLGDDFRPFVAKTKLLKTGKNSLALVVTVFGDNDDENGVFSGETFTVSLTGSGVADGIGTVRINNDD
jgi:hypothetical protein